MLIQPAGYLLGAPQARPQDGTQRALQSLLDQGWDLLLHRSYRSAPAQAQEAAQALASLKGDDYLQVIPPTGRAFEIRRKDEVETLDAFHGSKNLERLEHPELARKILALREEGIFVQPSAGTRTPDQHAWGAYLSMTRGAGAVIRLQRVELARVEGTDVDRALGKYQDILKVYRERLLPDTELQEFMLGEVARALNQPAGKLSLDQRCDVFLGLAQAVREGPDARLHKADRTGGALRLYELWMKKGGDPEILQRAARAVGHDLAQKASKYLLEELPQASFYPDGKKLREHAFLELLEAGVPPDVAARLTERMALQPEQIETCLEVVRLHPAAAEPNLDCVLTFPEEAGSYKTLLEGLQGIGRPEEAAPAFRFLLEGRRLGLLEEGMGALVTRYLGQLLLTEDPDRARAAMAGEDGRGVGIVREHKDSVQIGGVRLPVKRRHSA